MSALDWFLVLVVAGAAAGVTWSVWNEDSKCFDDFGHHVRCR